MTERPSLAGRPLSPLTLGTVSFGLSYGVANPAEIPDEATVHALLDMAWDGGVRCLDTAAAYGLAEDRVGAWHADRGHSVTIVSKLPALKDTPADAVADFVDSAIESGQRRLRTDFLDGFLAHGAADYARPELRAALAQAQRAGRIGLAGVSLYDPDQLIQALDDGPPGIVQVPLSLLDQRMITSGALQACAHAGVLVFARSVFVQGALLMPPEDLPAHLKGLGPVLTRLQGLAQEAGCQLQDLALRWVRDTPGVASMVVGVYDQAQLRAGLEAVMAPQLEKGLREMLSVLADDVPQSLCDPRKWRKE